MIISNSTRNVGNIKLCTVASKRYISKLISPMSICRAVENDGHLPRSHFYNHRYREADYHRNIVAQYQVLGSVPTSGDPLGLADGARWDGLIVICMF